MTLNVHIAPSAQFKQVSPFETYAPQGYRPLRREAYQPSRRSPAIGMLLSLATALATLGWIVSLAVMIHLR